MQRFIRHFAIFLIVAALVATPVWAAKLLIPGGQVIGIAVRDGTVSIAALADTPDCAKKAGLAAGDRIVCLDGVPIRTPQDLRAALSRSHGTVDVEILRAGRKKTLTLQPAATGDGPKLGIYLKEGATGIGTVTYYDPSNGTFGALGHGVNDPKGNLLPMESGTVYAATVLSVKKGTAGDPGQLMGTVTDTTPLAQLSKNVECGIYCHCARAADQSQNPFPPRGVSNFVEPLPVASKNQVKTGAATIRSTVDGTATREYSVEILKIYAGSGTRNLLLRVTDPALLAATGGIVQGMSGSPILQDGRIVGAVTHVLVNDPTMGYGIFIENMLAAAA